MYHTAKAVAELTDRDFPALAAQFPNLLTQTPPKHRPRKLPNGWWVYLNLSSDATIKYCQQIIDAAGIPKSEWNVE